MSVGDYIWPSSMHAWHWRGHLGLWLGNDGGPTVRILDPMDSRDKKYRVVAELEKPIC